MYPFFSFIFIIFSLFHCHEGDPNYEYISPVNFNNYVCFTTDETIKIDGRLNEKSWAKAAFSTSFIDIEGTKKPVPIYDTKVKMLWDKEFLYIGAILEEPHIWATYTERESVIFHENDFEIFIDPNGDTHNYYEIEVNALNTIWDLLLTKPYRDHGKAISSWNVEGMKSEVFLKGTLNDPNDVDEYWSIEFALPWSSLIEYASENRKPKDGEQWRINFSRVQWKLDAIDGQYKKQVNPETGKSYPEDNWVWSPQGVIAMHQPETWGYLQFSNQVVGTMDIPFIFNREEYCKWELRKIYYVQKAYYIKQKKYADDFDLFNINKTICPTPEVYLSVNENHFECELSCETCNKKWTINQDGLMICR